MNTIDLHMHSIYSDDGVYTPTELMKMCKDAGLQNCRNTQITTAQKRYLRQETPQKS